MYKEILISDFEICCNSYKSIHSAAPELYFPKPCIGYVKKGYAKFLYKGKTYYANEGDLIYIASETRYSSIWYGSPDIEWISILFDFLSKFSHFDYRFQIIKNYPPEIFDKMYEHHLSAPMLTISLFYELLSDIYKKMKVTSGTKSHSAIEPAASYIEENYASPISVEALSSMCHLSKSALFKQFKTTFGVTPIEYKHNFMIQHAIELLSNTNLSVDEISLKAGFSSSNYFRKVFTKLTDKTPKELRKK